MGRLFSVGKIMEDPDETPRQGAMENSNPVHTGLQGPRRPLPSSILNLSFSSVKWGEWQLRFPQDGGGHAERREFISPVSIRSRTQRESKIPTGHSTKRKAVHAGLVATALEVQRQPEALATPQHQLLLAQVGRVVVTSVGLNLQITPLQDQLYRDRNRGRHKPLRHLSVGCGLTPCALL